jgi:hypothetical protein
MRRRFFLSQLVGLYGLALITNVQAQTIITPAFNGSGAAQNNNPNNQVSTNFNPSLAQSPAGQNPAVGENASPAPGTSLGTNTDTVSGAGTNASGQPGTALGQRAPALGQRAPGQAGTALGQRAPGQAGTALGQPAPAIGPQRAPALGQQNNTAIGQQGTTAIGQQGGGTALVPPGPATGPTPFGAANNNINPPGTVTPGVGIQTNNLVPGTITNGFIVNSDGSLTALPGAGSTAITPGGTNTGTGVSPKNVFQTNQAPR